jgi:hypothetical protein
MSNCTPCTPANDELPIFCDPFPATDTAKRLLVEDEAFCQKALTSPTTPSSLVWDNGIKWLTQNGWKAISSTYFAKNGDKLSVNSVTGIFSIILPQNPPQFTEIVFADHYNSWGTNNVTINRNGSLIENLTDDLVLNTTWPTQITLRFEGSTWRVYSIV